MILCAAVADSIVLVKVVTVRIVQLLLYLQYFHLISSLKWVMMSQITPKHMLDNQILLKLSASKVGFS